MPAKDIGIQRRHDKKRSREILKFLQDGFPLSRINERKIVDPAEKDSLRMPGWIPTVIVANILTSDDRRGLKSEPVEPDDLVKLLHSDKSDIVQIQLPEGVSSDSWHPVVHPIEIIDGQHRLWALEEPHVDEEPWTEAFRREIAQIEFPVVAFHGLDRTWQAYLFYTINQLPRRVDSSMVFDLYPLLRDEEWLLKFEGPNIYRETRAQDLTVLLMTVEDSPWYDRVLRFGGREKGKVTQASFIRNLMATFIKSSQNTEKRIGGFFGAPYRSHTLSVDWSREQQAAFLIMIWKELKQAICTATDAEWIVELMAFRKQEFSSDSAKQRYLEAVEFDADTLIPTDQGVRGYLSVINDIVQLASESSMLKVHAWNWERDDDCEDDPQAVSSALKSLYKELTPLVSLIKKIVNALATFDWRLPTAMRSDSPSYNKQASYKGSSGYKLIRRNMLMHISNYDDEEVSGLAKEIVERLGYEDDSELEGQ